MFVVVVLSNVRVFVIEEVNFIAAALCALAHAFAPDGKPGIPEDDSILQNISISDGSGGGSSDVEYCVNAQQHKRNRAKAFTFAGYTFTFFPDNI